MDIQGFPYIIWRGVDSRQMGVWVAQYPDRSRATERVNRITIPGRAGELTIAEGEKVYETLSLQIRLQTLATNDFVALSDWLCGAGLLVIGREPTKAYYGRLTEGVDFTPYSKDIAEAVLSIDCEPFKRPYPDELPVTLTTTGTVTNSGNVPSKPLIRITGSGDITLIINGNALEIKDVDGTVTIDSGAMMVTDADGANILSQTSGEFPVLAVGSNSVDCAGTVTNIEIYVNRRWL